MSNRMQQQAPSAHEEGQWHPGQFVFYDGDLEWYVYRIHPMSYDIWAPMTGQIQYHLSGDTLDLLNSEVPDSPVKEAISPEQESFWDRMANAVENIIDDARKFHSDIFNEAKDFVPGDITTHDREVDDPGFVGGYDVSASRVEYLFGRLRSYYPEFSDREWTEISHLAQEFLQDEFLP